MKNSMIRVVCFATVSVADEAAAADKIAEIINDLFTEDR